MQVFEFAEFKIDAEERTLYRDGLPVALAPKIFDTLLVLVKNHGRLVTKETLMTEIWRETFVEENNLTQYIFVLRKTLGENSNGRKFIETVPRRGYRFVAEVSEITPISERNVQNLTDAKTVSEIDASQITPRSLTNNVEPITAPEIADEKRFEISNPKIENPQPINAREPKTFDAKPKTENLFPQLLRSRLVLISVFCLLAILAGASFMLRQTTKAWSPENIKFKALTEPGYYLDAALSPDGNSVAYVVRGKRGEIRLKNIQTDSEIVVANAEHPGFSSPRFSPDGNFIYYSFSEPGGNGTAFRVPIFGGEPRRIAVDLWSGFGISPDGAEIAFPRTIQDEKRKTVIVVASADGSGAERTVASRAEPDYFELYGIAPAWSEDGTRLLVSAGTLGAEGKHLIEIDLASNTERELELQDKWRYIGFLKWISNDALLITGQKAAGENLQLWQISFPGGAATRVTNDSNEYMSAGLSKNASRIVTTIETFNYHLWLFDRETNQIKQLTFGANRFDGNYGLAFAPDNRIVYAARDKNEYNIFSINADGGEARQLTKNAGRANYRPRVSPDGNLIAFVSNREKGLLRLWVMNADGSNQRRLTETTDDPASEEENPYFSPDGRFVYYSFYREGRGSIYKIAIDGNSAPIEIRRGGAAPVVSPDESEMVINYLDEDKKSAKPWQLRIQSLAADNPKEKIFDFPALFSHAQYLPGAPHTLVTADAKDDATNLWQTDYETGERRQITAFTAERIDNFDVSKDGRFFVMTRGSDLFQVVLIEK